jgi:hypothetical protein
MFVLRKFVDLDKIFWNSLCLNKNAINLLIKNQQKINKK